MQILERLKELFSFKDSSNSEDRYETIYFKNSFYKVGSPSFAEKVATTASNGTFLERVVIAKELAEQCRQFIDINREGCIRADPDIINENGGRIILTMLPNHSSALRNFCFAWEKGESLELKYIEIGTSPEYDRFHGSYEFKPLIEYEFEDLIIDSYITSTFLAFSRRNIHRSTILRDYNWIELPPIKPIKKDRDPWENWDRVGGIDYASYHKYCFKHIIPYDVKKRTPRKENFVLGITFNGSWSNKALKTIKTEMPRVLGNRFLWKFKFPTTGQILVQLSTVTNPCYQNEMRLRTNIVLLKAIAAQRDIMLPDIELENCPPLESSDIWKQIESLSWFFPKTIKYNYRPDESGWFDDKEWQWASESFWKMPEEAFTEHYLIIISDLKNIYATEK